ncbi:MAG: hypothetical protein HY783_04135 [Chloroflexi bacterium]|nr:hypothetical protein [Chloroflexota bacterium]
MSTRNLWILLFVLWALAMPAPSAWCSPSKTLLLDRMWLDATEAELQEAGLSPISSGKSRIIENATMVRYGESTSAHFAEGKAKLLMGDRLYLGEKLVIQSGWSMHEVGKSLNLIGWRLVDKRRHRSDSGRRFEVWKYSYGGAVILVPFSGDDEDKVGSIVVRDKNTRGPFGPHF